MVAAIYRKGWEGPSPSTKEHPGPDSVLVWW